ncbi:cytochrome P450 [Xylariaceae sp. FL0016]|nr:cytochrome P450 [Xylariaceae sp. FL0016]
MTRRGSNSLPVGMLLVATNSLLDAAAVLVASASLLYIVYRWSLPVPLPGIPYNAEAVKTPLGDIPGIAAVERSGGRSSQWFAEQGRRHGSAVVQVFMEPLGRPSVVVSGFREVYEMLHCRDVDRGTLGTLPELVMPEAQVAMNLTDPRVRRNREMVREVMSARFTRNVNAPVIYRELVRLVELWREKSRIVDGRPHNCTFDMISAAAYGQNGDDSRTLTQLRDLQASKPLVADVPDSSGVVAAEATAHPFPTLPQSPEMRAVETHVRALALRNALPLPRVFFSAYKRLAPSLRRASGTMDDLLRRQLRASVSRLMSTGPGGFVPVSALDTMVLRETTHGVEPRGGEEEMEMVSELRRSGAVRDELYTYIMAGHETTSTALAWMVRHLAGDRTRAQSRLRSAVRDAHAAAYGERRQLRLDEATGVRVPYLDAFVEESLRLSAAVPVVAREAMRDTVLAGRWVPRGTRIYVALSGPGINEAGVSLRSEGPEGTGPEEEEKKEEEEESRRKARSKQNIPCEWDPSLPPDEFHPERWLRRQGENGKVVFDGRAGPSLAFGAGLRACFGRQLAYLQLRTALVLLVWSFEFGELGGDGWAHFEAEDVPCAVV